MRTTTIVLTCVSFALTVSQGLSQTVKQFDPYWKKVPSFKVPASTTAEYLRLSEKIKGFTVQGQSLVPLPGYSLFLNQNSLLLTPGNEGTTQISHASVTKIPGLGERLKWLFKDGTVLAYYCTCSNGEGGCRIWELDCIKEGCSDCGSRWVIGSPGSGPIVIEQGIAAGRKPSNRCPKSPAALAAAL
jgi:hypothetical protein